MKTINTILFLFLTQLIFGQNGSFTNNKTIIVIGQKYGHKIPEGCLMTAFKIINDIVQIDTCYDLTSNNFSVDKSESIKTNQLYTDIIKQTNSKWRQIESDIENSNCDYLGSLIIKISEIDKTEIFSLKQNTCYPEYAKKIMGNLEKYFTYRKNETVKYWIYDTVNVNCYLDTHSYISDTVAQLKRKLSNLDVEKAIIYWDKEMKHKYTEFFLGDPDSTVTYYRNGQINDKKIYIDKNGQKLERYIWNQWYSDGKKKYERIISEKNEYSFYYYNNGQIRHKGVGVLDDIQRGFGKYRYIYYEGFCENGQLMYKDSINSTIMREIVNYHCNGTISKKFIFNGANVLGKWQEWYSNGQLSIDGQYNFEIPKDSILYYGISKKQGDWKYFDQSGKLIKIERYNNDKILETIKY